MLTTKEFAEASGVPYGTLRRWRSKYRGTNEGKQGVLIPAVVDAHGRCFYDESQLDIARRLHDPYFGQPKLFKEMIDMPTNETATADDQTPADAQNTVKIDDEFKNLIPPLADDEFQQLEENLLRDGIQDSLKTWQGILIDGHNRYSIAQKHGLPFKVTEMEFADRDAVKMWIVQNQFGRRNVNRYSRGELVLKLEPSIAAQAKANQQLSEGRGKKGLANLPNLNTRDELAKIAGVSSRLMAKIKFIVEHGTDEIKAALRADDLTINAAFNGIKAGAMTVDDVLVIKKSLMYSGDDNESPSPKTAREDNSIPVDKVVEPTDAPTNDDGEDSSIDGERICDGKISAIVTNDDDEREEIANVPNQHVPAQIVDTSDDVQDSSGDATRAEIAALLARVEELILRTDDDDALTVTKAGLAGIVDALEKKIARRSRRAEMIIDR